MTSSSESEPPFLIDRAADSVSSDSNPPSLMERRPNESSSDDSDLSLDDDEPPLMGSRFPIVNQVPPAEHQNPNNRNNIPVSESSDDGSMPPLIGRDNGSNTSSSSDDSSAMPELDRNGYSSSSSDSHLPRLRPRRQQQETAAEQRRRTRQPPPETAAEQRRRNQQQREAEQEREKVARIQAKKRQQRANKRKRQAQKLKLAKLVQHHWRRHQAQQEYRAIRQGCIQIQSLGRRYLVQLQWNEMLQARIHDMRRFQKMKWSDTFALLPKNDLYTVETWEHIKETLFDTRKQVDSWTLNAMEDDEFKKEHEATNEVIDSAYLYMQKQQPQGDALDEEEAVLAAFHSASSVDDDEESLTHETIVVEARPRCDHIQLTKDVLKWFDRQDSQYRGMFLKRISQLANGHRSYVTHKRLTGCKNTIWESKLDKGMRILYTERNLKKEDSNILVYYVSKHDNVSRLLKLIEEAENRSRRQVIHSQELAVASKLYEKSPHPLLPDPLGDTPLKVHALELQELPKMAKSHWKPRLVLTPEERRCVEKKGTVLLLGRSGTGKTVCIADRMGYDRQTFLDGRSEEDCTSKLTQLFVARNYRIGRYVQGMVDGGVAVEKSFISTNYSTFSKFLHNVEQTLGGHSRQFQAYDHVNFGKFYREFASEHDSELGPLIVWSQIRSFIKGSIEAVMADRALTLEEYLNLGEKRSRLTDAQKKKAYSLYERYNSHFLVEGRWDDCDRVASLLKLIGNADRETREKLSYDKVYVDEIQDYTSAEVALFFLLSRPDGLFLAGDTAQSVVEGVEFRFDDVRSVAHTLYPQDKDRRYIPDKPLTVNRNFRSHAGILNVAAAILDRLFAAFPKSAKKLEPDVGVFVGPRPGLLYPLNNSKLKELVARMEGVVVLTHDGKEGALSEIINQGAAISTMVLGIRESKGLEFPNILIVDFFKGIPEEHQKEWRQLLSIREEVKSNLNGNVAPEVETQVKLLYTAITRCGKRLLFAETGSSIAGDAFSKWVTIKQNEEENSLAVRQAVKDVEALTRTADEWVSAGIDCALEAENCSDETDKASKWLQFAIENLEKGSAPNYIMNKVQHHADSVKLRQVLNACYPIGSDQHKNMDVDAIEAKSSKVLRQLVGDCFFVEARKLVETLIPLLGDYSKQHLQRELAALMEVEQ